MIEQLELDRHRDVAVPANASLRSVVRDAASLVDDQPIAGAQPVGGRDGIVIRLVPDVVRVKVIRSAAAKEIRVGDDENSRL